MCWCRPVLALFVVVKTVGDAVLWFRFRGCVCLGASALSVVDKSFVWKFLQVATVLQRSLDETRVATREERQTRERQEHKKPSSLRPTPNHPEMPSPVSSGVNSQGNSVKAYTTLRYPVSER